MATSQTSSVSSPKAKAPRTQEQVERDITRVELALRPEALAEEGGTRNAVRKREKRLQEKLHGLREELNGLVDSSTPEPVPVRDPKVPTKEYIDWPTAPYRVHLDSPDESKRSHMVDRHVWESLCGRYQIVRGFDVYRGGEEAKQLRIQAQYRRPSGTGDRWAWIETPKGRDGKSLGNYPVLYHSLEAAFQAVRIFHEKTTGVFPVDNQEEVLLAARQRGILSNGTNPPHSGGAKETDMTTATTTDTMDLTLTQARELLAATGYDSGLSESLTGEKARKAFSIKLASWAKPKVRAAVKDVEIDDEPTAQLRDEVLSHLEGGGKLKVILHVSDSSESNGEADEEAPTPKGKKGDKKSSAPKEPKQKAERGPGKKGGGRKTDILGYSSTALLRWMARDSWTLEEARKALEHYGVLSLIQPSTVGAVMSAARRDAGRPAASPTKEEIAQLREAAGKSPKSGGKKVKATASAD